MGTGEPMDNFDNLLKFIELLTDENGLNISQRNVTVSTCGIVPRIRQFAEEGLQVTCGQKITDHACIIPACIHAGKAAGIDAGRK